MYETAKSLEIVEVEVYGCFILCPYLFLHKTLILCNVIYRFFDRDIALFLYISYSPTYPCSYNILFVLYINILISYLRNYY